MKELKSLTKVVFGQIAKASIVAFGTKKSSHKKGWLWPSFFYRYSQNEKHELPSIKPNPRYTKESSEEIKTLTDIIIRYQKECSEKACQQIRNIIPYDPNHCCKFMHDDLKGENTEEIFLRCVRNTKRHQARIPKKYAEDTVKKLMDHPALSPLLPPPLTKILRTCMTR